jgi:hypothetical protein
LITIKQLSAVVAEHNLTVKSIFSVESGAFMVPTQKEEVVRILDFVGKEEAYHFYALTATIDII